jgi:glycosyltransferase involved in cell wall biosynthesis
LKDNHLKYLDVLIVEPYPFGKICGNLRTLNYILHYFDRSSFNLHLAVPLESDYTRKVAEQGVDVVVVKPHQRLLQYGGNALRDTRLGRLLTMAATVGYNLQFLKILRDKKIAVIYCNCIRSVLYIALAARLSRTPLLWYIKGELQNRLLDTMGFAAVNKILFFCEANKHDKYPALVKMFKNKIDILRIGLDSEEIRQAERSDKSRLITELAIDRNKVNLACVGQLYPPKGIHYLLEALDLIVPDFPDLHLYIIGHHVIDEYREYQTELQQFIRKHRLEPYVTFTGWRNDVLEAVSLMDILVHPSLSEGFGRAVLEAMALGKPVVASKVGGLREIIKDGEDGFLVEPGDIQGLAEKISRLLRDKPLRGIFGRASREKVFSDYLVEDKVVRLEVIWRDMVSWPA